MEDKFLDNAKRLMKQGIAGDAALSFLKQLENEALKEVLIEKGILTDAEVRERHEKLMEEWAEKIEKMPPLPGQIKPIAGR